MQDHLLMPRSLANSYAQPDWLIEKARLGQHLPPRVVLNDLWKVQPSALDEALKNEAV
jgi:5-methyltetrahydropteroyltriglutamate--homocysteine methyltransferase